jgi:methionyl-tRNA synthetase
MERQALHRVIEAVWAVVADANRYFASEEPWALKKTDPARMATVLYVTAEVLRQLGVITQPFIPASANKLLDQIGVDPARSFDQLGPEHRLKPGTQLGTLQPIFPRYVEPEAAPAA